MHLRLRARISRFEIIASRNWIGAQASCAGRAAEILHQRHRTALGKCRDVVCLKMMLAVPK
eukprot:2076537-Rhodomonas_salina.2